MGCSFESRADSSFLVYDIFSDDPKGILNLCNNHVGYSSDPTEGYFTCACCQRVMVENYTWEYYRVERDGETVCSARFSSETPSGGRPGGQNWTSSTPSNSVSIVSIFDSRISTQLMYLRCRFSFSASHGISLVSRLKLASVSPSMCLTISGEVVMDLRFLLMPGQYQNCRPSAFLNLPGRPEGAPPALMRSAPTGVSTNALH